MLALWVTNRERHRRFIDAELLPVWGLRHVATWHWLKVTNDGQLVSPLVQLYAATSWAIKSKWTLCQIQDTTCKSTKDCMDMIKVDKAFTHA